VHGVTPSTASHIKNHKNSRDFFFFFLQVCYICYKVKGGFRVRRTPVQESKIALSLRLSQKIITVLLSYAVEDEKLISLCTNHPGSVKRDLTFL